MSNSLKEKTFPIKITNFTNPHLFHFKLDNIIVGKVDFDMENELGEDAKTQSWTHPTGYHPEVHEIVCAYIVEWRKWVRAVVDVVFDLDSGPGKQYIIWCLDHGVPMKLGAEHLLPMQEKFKQLPATAYRGGLAKCVPIHKRLNYRKSEYEIENADRFSDFLTTFAKQLLDEASEILFKPLQKMDDDHIFGDIHIVQHTGHKVDMLRELVKRADGVRIDENDIPFGIENWCTTKTPRYKTDQGQLNIRQMAYVPLSNNSKRNKNHRSMMSVCSADLGDDEKLILNWSRKNTELADDMDNINKNQFKTVIDELDRYVMATREQREPFHKFYNAPSMSSVNQSNHNLFSCNSSQSTLYEVQSIAGQSDVASTFSTPSAVRFGKRLAQAGKQPSNATAKPTTTQNVRKEVFIPSGFERDILEFHKYNEF